MGAGRGSPAPHIRIGFFHGLHRHLNSFASLPPDMRWQTTSNESGRFIARSMWGTFRLFSENACPWAAAPLGIAVSFAGLRHSRIPFFTWPWRTGGPCLEDVAVTSLPMGSDPDDITRCYERGSGLAGLLACRCSAMASRSEANAVHEGTGPR